MLTEDSRKGSVWWKYLCSLENGRVEWQEGWMSESLLKVVGSGHDTSFRNEPWVEGGLLCDRFLRLYSLSSNKGKLVADLGDWLEGVWRWKWKWRSELFQWEMALEQ